MKTMTTRRRFLETVGGGLTGSCLARALPLGVGVLGWPRARRKKFVAKGGKTMKNKVLALAIALAMILVLFTTPGAASAQAGVTNTGAVGQELSASGSIIAFHTYERMNGQDLNGDGDTVDFVIRYYDTAMGTVTNTGAVGAAPSASGSLIFFTTAEYGIGQDLNGDGDLYDPVIRHYDTATGTVTNTGVVADWAPSASGSLIAFSTPEYWIGQDLNGDGDTDDYVIRYFTISRAGTIESIQALIDARLADGSIDNEGVAQALRAFLEQAQARFDRGNNKAAINTLNAFIKAVRAQAGKHITSVAAQSLTDAAQAVISGLQ